MVALTGKRILLCEDHSLNASITIKVLEHEGISVVHADKDGLDAARAIRSSRKADAGTIPIIAMTAKDCGEDRNNSLAAGMNAHFAKPVDPTNLYNILAALIKA